MKKTIAVVGAGRWGKNLVRNFYKLGVLGAVCEQSEELRTGLAQEYPDCRITDSLTSVLEDDAIQGITVATPAVTHGELVEQCLLAGKHVMVEKPLCLSSSVGEKLVTLAARQKKTLSVGHVLEYHPGILKLKSIIDQGDLGEVHYIYSNRLNLGTIRTEENILWSFAPHDVAVILRLTGMMPFQVVACGGSYLQPNVADVTLTHLFFDSGVRAHIHVSWLHPFKEQRLVVVGSRRMASFDDVGKSLIVYDRRGVMEEGLPVTQKGEGEVIEYDEAEPLRLECSAFVDAVSTGQSTLTDGESGLRVLRVLEAAQRSLVTQGQPVALNVDAFAVT